MSNYRKSLSALLRICSILFLTGLALPGQADVIYNNYDPLLWDHNVNGSQGASSVSMNCGNAYCNWINRDSVSMTFTASDSGLATSAYVPLSQPYWYYGANTIHVMYFYDLINPNVAIGCAGISNNGPLPANNGISQSFEMVMRPFENGNVDPWCSNTLGSGVDFTAGHQYQAQFLGIFGAINNTYWHNSTQIAAPGEATAHCNILHNGVNCGDTPLAYLPGLALATGTGFTQNVPEPACAFLLLTGLTFMRRQRLLAKRPH